MPSLTPTAVDVWSHDKKSRVVAGPTNGPSAPPPTHTMTASLLSELPRPSSRERPLPPPLGTPTGPSPQNRPITAPRAKSPDRSLAGDSSIGTSTAMLSGSAVLFARSRELHDRSVASSVRRPQDHILAGLARPGKALEAMEHPAVFTAHLQMGAPKALSEREVIRHHGKTQSRTPGSFLATSLSSSDKGGLVKTDAAHIVRIPQYQHK